MKTYLECIPCFFRQCIEASRSAGFDDAGIKKIIDKTALLVAGSGLELSPPEFSGLMHEIIKKESGVEDYFKDAKDKSNNLALSVYELCKKKVVGSSDPLLAAIETAIAGNIIDFGVKHSIDIEKEVEKIISKEEKKVKNENEKYFAYESFKEHLSKTDTLIYLADNAGEVLFDRVLIEEIKSIYPKMKIYFAVKERPIINDALYSDAVKCGLNGCAEIVSSGSLIPGTVLRLCSPDFLSLYKNADMIISKGQGNFESFVDETKPVFYLFMAKCAPVAKETGSVIGTINLYFNSFMQEK